MNIVDSSAWLEYFAGTSRAKHFERAIEKTDELIVPSIVLYEVFKKMLLERGDAAAFQVVAHMKLGRIIDIDTELALIAAKLSAEHKLPMADSIILATAQKYGATLWTQDGDFKGFKGVKYFEKY